MSSWKLTISLCAHPLHSCSRGRGTARHCPDQQQNCKQTFRETEKTHRDKCQCDRGDTRMLLWWHNIQVWVWHWHKGTYVILAWTQYTNADVTLTQGHKCAQVLVWHGNKGTSVMLAWIQYVGVVVIWTQYIGVVVTWTQYIGVVVTWRRSTSVVVIWKQYISVVVT